MMYKSHKKFRFFQRLSAVFACFCVFFQTVFVESSYLPTVGSNIGIGTSTPAGGLVVMNGNVGVGTWSPTQRLQVVGTVSATSFVGDGSGLTGISANSGWTDGGANVYTSTTTDLVAVGTTTPVSRLTVKGNVGIGTTTPYTTIAAPANGMIVEGNVGVGTFAAASGKLIVMGGNAGIGTITPAATLDVFGKIAQGGLVVFDTMTAPGSVLIGNGAGRSVDPTSGAIAIGTDSLATTSVPTSADIAIGNLALNSLAGGTGNFAVGTGALRWMSGGWYNVAVGELAGTNQSTGDNNTYIGRGSASAQISGNNNVYIGFSSGINQASGDNNILIGSSVDAPLFSGSNQLNIGNTVYGHLASKTVGIGTFTVVSKLVVNGGVGIGTVSTSSFINTAAPSGGLIVENNVGIGTLSPTSKLQVIGTVSATAFVGDGSGLTGISAGSTGWTDGGTNIYNSITTDNVAIGTTTPTAVLLVENAGTQDTLRINDAVLDGSPFIIDAGGNAGIGTTTPSEKLVVGGNIAFSGASPTLKGTTGQNLSLEANGNANQLVLGASGQVAVGNTSNIGSADFMVRSGDSAIMRLNSGDDGMWDLNSDVTSKDLLITLAGGAGTKVNVSNAGLVVSGNVGIGTTAPVGGLAVMRGNVGIGTWSPTARLQVIGTVAATAFVGDGSGLTGISANSGWTDGGTNVYTTTITDNVGIGTTTPTVRLHVPWISGDTTTTAYFGALNMSDNQTAVVAQSGTGGGVFGESVTYIGVNGYSNSSSGIRGESASGYGVEGASDSSSSGFFRARLSGNATATLLTKQNGAGTADLFQAQNDTGTSLVNITSAGNMGIGTWIPAQRLQVIGTVNATAFVGDGSGLTNLPTGGGWTDGGTNVYTSTTTDNVGIGTTTPTAALLIENAGTQASFRVNDTVADGSPFIIDATGNVGIGTTEPSAMLHAYDPDDSAEIIIESGEIANTDVSKLILYSRTNGVDGDSYGIIRMGGSGTNGAEIRTLLYQAGAGGTETNLTFATDGESDDLQERMRITHAGNVGIGTTSPVGGLVVMNGNVGIGTWSPTQKLQVVGTVNATAFVGDGSGLTNLPTSGGWTDGGTNIYQSTTTDLVAVGTTTPVSTLTVKGNVGIGTTTPYTTIAASANGMIVEGNVGIGTFAAVNGKLIVMGGNVGIGDITPDGVLDFDLISTSTTAGSQYGSYFTVDDSGVVTSGSDSTYGNFLVLSRSGATGGTINTFGNYVYASSIDQAGAGTSNLYGNYVTLASGPDGADNNYGYYANFQPGQPSLTYGFYANNTTGPSAGGTTYGFYSSVTAQAAAATAYGLYVDAGTGSGTEYAAVFLNGNVGIGTFAPRGRLIVASGNVGIGTLDPVGALTVMNGNVGIGTWSPTQRLQVIGTVNATAFVGDGSGLTGISAGSTGWSDGGTNVYNSITTDNVAIGTTTPEAKLHVVGNVRIGKINTSTSNASLEFISDTDPWIALDRDGTPATMLIGSTSSSGQVAIEGTSRLEFKNGITWNAHPSTTGTIRMVIDGNGNVGIGTWVPASQLNIIGNVGVGTTLPYRRIAAPTNGMAIEGNVGIGTWAASNGKLIVMGGNVGIGTASPSFQLEIRGNLAGDLGASYVNTNAGGFANNRFLNDGLAQAWIGIGGSSTAEGWANRAFLSGSSSGVSIDATGGGVSPDIRFYTGAGTPTSANERGRITYTGNFGIGTTTPVGALTVMNGNVGIGTWSPTARLQVVGSVMATSFVGDGSGLTGISAGSTGWTDGGTNVYTSTTADNVGIGTTTPAAPLHVRSAEAANASGQEVLRVAGNNGIAGSGPAVAFTDQFGNDIGEIRSYWEATAQAGMSFGVNGGQGQLHISGTGNVGIGSTAPNARLDLRQTLSSVTGGTSLYYGYLSFAPSAPTGGADQPYGMLQDTWYSGVNDISSWETSSIKGRAFSSMDAAAELSSTAGVEGHGVQAGDGQIGDLYGVYGYAYKAGVGDVVRMTGVYGRAYNLNTTGSVLNLIGGNFSTVTDPNTTVTNATAVSGDVSAGVTTAMSTAKAVSARVTTSGTITDAYGLYVDTIQGSNKWAVYATDATTPSFFAGNIGVGTTVPVGGMSVMNGNVGIGTWSPTARLQVVGTVNATAFVGDGSGLTGISAGGWTDGGTNVYTSTTTDNVAIGTTTPGGKFVVMGGNVGIGSASPSSVLDVQAGSGNISLKSTGRTRLGDVLFQANGIGFEINDTAQTVSFGDIGGSSNTVYFLLDNLQQRFYLLNGNVGIGTLLPRGTLEVKSPASSAQITINGPSGGCLMFRDTDNSGWTECNALNGVLTCSVDADGICDGS